MRTWGFALALILAACAAEEAPLTRDHVGPAPAADAAALAPEPDALPPEGPLELTVTRSIFASIRNNRAFAVQRLTPEIRRAYEDRALAAFDPRLKAEVSQSRTLYKQPVQGTDTLSDASKNATSASVGVETALTTGTTVGVGVQADLTDSSLYADETSAGRVGLTLTQSLLRGFGTDVNLATLRQAELDTRASEYELRGFAEALVAEVETTYWDYAAALARIDIYVNSLALAEQQLREIRERIAVGRIPESELAAAQAEVAVRNEGLIDARSALARIGLRLLRLLNARWDREIRLQTKPSAPDAKLEPVGEHVAVAMLFRTDLNQARLAIRRGELEVVKTRNGLLPRLDFFATLGQTGYAHSFGDTIVDRDRDFDLLAGLRFEFPVENRYAAAVHRQAVLTDQQTRQALGNLEELAEQDVRSAYLEAERSRSQIAATAATRAFRQEALRAETEKLQAGRSTSLLVGQAQRDLLASEIAEVQSVVDHLKALVGLYRLEGSLLERRGILAPGREPAEPPSPR